MSTTLKCQECKTGQISEQTGDYHTVYNDGETTRKLVVPHLTWWECDQCGDVVLDAAAMEQIEALRSAVVGLPRKGAK